jgi:hypothetical protein
MNITKLLYFILLGVGSVIVPLSAQVPTLEAFEARFNEELGKIRAENQGKVSGLRRNYMAALLRFESTARQNGDLEGVEATRKEIQRIESSENLEPENDSTHPDILNMQGVIRETLQTYQLEEAREIETLLRNVATYVDSASSSLTQNNQIQDAIAWRNWGEALKDRPVLASALQRLKEEKAEVKEAENAAADPNGFHQALQGNPVEVVKEVAKKFPSGPRLYAAGSEPKGDDKRIGGSKIPSAAGAGMSLLTSRIRLIEEDETLHSDRTSYYSSKSKSLLYVARVEMSPLPGKPLGRTLVVFDMFKRGSGSKREIIRTDHILLPPIDPGQRVVIDSSPYAYETSKVRYFGQSYSGSTADEFYGYVVTMFNENGELFYQRATDTMLVDYARKTPPTNIGPQGPPPENPVEEGVPPMEGQP